MEEHRFNLVSNYTPAGDQPEAIRQLVAGLAAGEAHQVLLGVTGSGKTFTIANVISEVQRPTLILSHNKTLAAQLYGEFRGFFPDNLVEYFISYYDYYQPEAYIPSTNTYIEKDLQLNADIEKLRLRATSALCMGRRDVIVVSSVSCIYGIGKPEDYEANIFSVHAGQQMTQNMFLDKLVRLFYNRAQEGLGVGQFRVKGDTVDIAPAYDDYGVRVVFFGHEVEAIQRFDVGSGRKYDGRTDYTFYPANLFVTPREVVNDALQHIAVDLGKQIDYFKRQGMHEEAKRIKERTEHDLEMMRELGYCSGIENYSRYLSQRPPGSRPYCLLDYFPDDFLLIVDESHVTLPQIRGMYGGDRSRKLVLVEHGFRLPSALDNRPQMWDEFESLLSQTIYVSATPGEVELQKAEGVVVEQIVRPTGLLDPPVEVRPCTTQVDDLLEEIDNTVKAGFRVLATTLTKRMSEELSRYIGQLGIRCRYLHSDIDSLERVEILGQLREGKIDVLIGVNLLREGLDLPEVGLVAIMDADKEGFLRSDRSLIQTAGRAARNAKGRVILYGDKVTDSMRKLIEETNYRRAKQIAYNEAHGIVPKTVIRAQRDVFSDLRMDSPRAKAEILAPSPDELLMAAEEGAEYMSQEQVQQKIKGLRKEMEAAAKELDFIRAAKLRDELLAWQGKVRRPI